MIGRIWFGKTRIASAGVVEVPAIDHNPADARPVSTDEFGRAVGDHVRAPFERPEQIRRGKGVINQQDDLVLLGDFGHFFEGENRNIRIAEGFAINQPGVRANGFLEILGISRVDKGHFNPQFGQGVVELIVRPTIQTTGGDDMVATAQQGENRLGLGGVTAGRGHRSDTAFERGNPLFKDIGGRVHQAGINVAQFFQREQIGSMVSRFELVAGGLVKRHGAAAGSRIGGIASVQLLGSETVLARVGGHEIVSW